MRIHIYTAIVQRDKITTRYFNLLFGSEHVAKCGKQPKAIVCKCINKTAIIHFVEMYRGPKNLGVNSFIIDFHACICKCVAVNHYTCHKN